MENGPLLGERQGAGLLPYFLKILKNKPSFVSPQLLDSYLECIAGLDQSLLRRLLS